MRYGSSARTICDDNEYYIYSASTQIIKSYNEVFLDKLEKRVTTWNDESSCVGDLFVEMVRMQLERSVELPAFLLISIEQCQWFKTYITYINNYTLAISTLAECQSRDSFGKFLSVRCVLH